MALPYFLPVLDDEPGDRIIARGADGVVILDRKTSEVVDTFDLRYYDHEHAVVDTAGRRLYSDSLGRGLLAWNLDTLEPLAGLDLPLPEAPLESVAMHEPEPSSRRWPAPVLDPVTSRLLVFRDRRVFVVGTRPLEVERVVEAAVSPADGPILGAQLDATSRMVYLWAHDSQIPSAYVGTRLVGLDLDTWEMDFEAEAPGELLSVLAWRGRLAAVDQMYKRFGIHIRLWKNGRLQRHIVDGSDVTPIEGNASDIALVHDALGHRLLMSDGVMLWVMDPDSLELRLVVPQPGSGRLLGFEPGGKVLRFGDQRRLASAAIPTLAAEHRPSREIESEEIHVLFGAQAPGAAPSDQIVVPGHSWRCVLRSESLGERWTCADSGLPTSAEQGPNIGDVEVLPRGDRPAYLLVPVSGYGLFRAQDVAHPHWQPVNEGLSSLTIVGLEISPNVEHDGLVFARSRLGRLFRSTDWGGSWAEVGDIRLPAFSPEFATNDRLFSFEQGGGKALRSDDAGRSWTPLGALPDRGIEGIEIKVLDAPGGAGKTAMLAYGAGGYAMLTSTEPSMLHRFYRSEDGGMTWSLVLDPAPTDGDPWSEWPDLVLASWHGPIATNDGDLFVALAGYWKNGDDRTREPIFISKDDGRSWQAGTVDREAARRFRLLQVADDGSLLTTTEEAGRLEWTTVAAWLDRLDTSPNSGSFLDGPSPSLEPTAGELAP